MVLIISEFTIWLVKDLGPHVQRVHIHKIVHFSTLAFRFKGILRMIFTLVIKRNN